MDSSKNKSSFRGIFFSDYFNPFVPNAPFLYPPEVEKGRIGKKWVKNDSIVKLWHNRKYKKIIKNADEL